MHPFLFYFFSGIAIFCSLLVISLPRPNRSLFALVTSMFALSVLYLLLGAYFIAMVHLIVYAGAILVLFLFVIMFLGLEAKDIRLAARFPKLSLLAFILTGILFGSIFLLILSQVKIVSPVNHFPGTIEKIGLALFTDYLIPFEVTSLLLLLGVLAAMALAKKEKSSV